MWTLFPSFKTVALPITQQCTLLHLSWHILQHILEHWPLMMVLPRIPLPTYDIKINLIFDCCWWFLALSPFHRDHLIKYFTVAYWLDLYCYGMSFLALLYPSKSLINRFLLSLVVFNCFAYFTELIKVKFLFYLSACPVFYPKHHGCWKQTKKVVSLPPFGLLCCFASPFWLKH